MLTDKLLVVMLKASKTGIDIHQLARELNISSNIVNDVLREYENRGLVTIHHDELSATPLQRLNLATLAINRGISIEQVAHYLEWQEFEDLAIRVLHHHSYSTKKHYRFKRQDRRFEIDIVGVKQPLILSIDCKHWKKSWQRSATLQMIDRQLTRTEALVEYWMSRNSGTNHVRFQILPLVLTLYETPIKRYKGVPVIPIFFFQNFLLNELPSHLNDFMTFEFTN